MAYVLNTVATYYKFYMQAKTYYLVCCHFVLTCSTNMVPREGEGAAFGGWEVEEVWQESEYYPEI